MNVERPNTLAGLAEKRAEIAGQIAHTRATLRQLIIDLDHVDAAIRIFNPAYGRGAPGQWVFSTLISLYEISESASMHDSQIWELSWRVFQPP